MGDVADLIERDFYPTTGTPTVEITEAGYLHLDAELAATRFPADACVARCVGDTLELMPLISAAHGGLVLRQRNPAGDRTLLIHEVLGFGQLHGLFPAHWDEHDGILRVSLVTAGSAEESASAPPERQETGDAARGLDRGRQGVRPVDGLPAGHHRPGSGATSRLDPRLAGPRDAGGRRDQAHGESTTSTRGGSR